MPSAASRSEPRSPGELVFGGALGLWLGLALIKFGNPVVLGLDVDAPEGLLELLLSPWPMSWGYGLLGLLALGSLRFWRWSVPVPSWLVMLPLSWMIWQVIAGIQTIDPAATRPVLMHFGACLGGFYLGLYALSPIGSLRLFWISLLGAFLVVLAVGWQQHFGGLEATRQSFYANPEWQNYPYPPEFLKRLNSDRIYSTLLYPNTLAGVIILLLPALIAAAFRGRETGDGPLGKWLLAGVAAAAGLACLYWSGSKAGWLIVLAMALVATLHLRFSWRTKLATTAVLALVGLAGFGIAYAKYFAGGARSASARMDYWTAAWRLVLEKPILGSGPGTFALGYERLKPAKAEMSRLVHNDYLQQATDSGVLAALLYAGLLGGSLIWLYPRCRGSRVRWAFWLGLSGFAVQSVVEFGLYIPATAWTQFTLLGWLLGSTPAPLQAEKPDLSSPGADSPSLSI